jgi:peptide/nickel transport system permease protein
MGLWGFIARRLIMALLVLVIVSLATFLLTQAVPGDPISAILSDRQADNPEVRAALEKRWGLDQPMPVQYVVYVGNLLQGDWGESISKRTPVAQELRHRVPATIELTIFALFFAMIVGFPLGVVAALNRDRWPDHVARFISLVGTSLPVFWLGLLMLYTFT